MLSGFNKYINGDSTPEYWSMANMVCLHKKGDETDLNNYRGISLINTISKIYLKIINDRLTQFVEENEIISRYQTAFREGEECMNQITSLLEIVRRRQFKGQNTVLCFIDFEKAYDNVCHDLLFKKLEKLNIPKYLINTIKDIYKNTTMQVKIAGETSSGYSYRKGVRQGCPCSPMLFNIFINDIFEGIEGILIPKSNTKVPGLMFADDIVVFGNNNNDLANKIRKISKWAVDNRMRINCKKSGVLEWSVHNSAPVNRSLFSIPTDFGDIDEVTEYRYLGVLITKNTLEEHIVNDAAMRGKKTLDTLMPKLVNSRTPLTFKAILVKCVLVPTLMYGSELWGMSSTRAGKINRILRKSLRLIFKRVLVPLDRIMDEFKIERIHIQAALSRYRAYNKWKHNKTIISDIISINPKERKTTWCSRTQRWLKRFVGNDYENGDSRLITTKIIDVLRSRRTLNTSVAASIANKYDIKDSQIKYVIQKVNNRKIRTYTRLRCNLVKWSSRMATSNRIPMVYRSKCFLCEGPLEDLEHCLIDCALLSETRNQYAEKLPVLQCSRTSNQDKVKFILGNKEGLKHNPSKVNELCTCIEFIDKMIVNRAILIQNKLNDINHNN